MNCFVYQQCCGGVTWTYQLLSNIYQEVYTSFSFNNIFFVWYPIMCLRRKKVLFFNNLKLLWRFYPVIREKFSKIQMLIKIAILMSWNSVCRSLPWWWMEMHEKKKKKKKWKIKFYAFLKFTYFEGHIFKIELFYYFLLLFSILVLSSNGVQIFRAIALFNLEIFNLKFFNRQKPIFEITQNIEVSKIFWFSNFCEHFYHLSGYHL